MVASPDVLRLIKFSPGDWQKLDPDQPPNRRCDRLSADAGFAKPNALDMSSLDIAANESLRRDETVLVAVLLAFTAGCLDAYAWIVHGVMANGQTANLILLWVHGSTGNWVEPIHFVPPMIAFAVGVVVAAWLRRAAGDRAGAISTLVEILMLILVAVLHNRLPDLAGTLGISFVAAMQTAVFIRVEGVPYSSVMITGNMRQAIECLFAAICGDQSGALRGSSIFASLCLTFGVGAAVGAFATKGIPNLALGLPVLTLLVVLLCCDIRRNEARS
jgi:uncharacterized membrane protein YoaK (UPF0700 family)